MLSKAKWLYDQARASEVGLRAFGLSKHREKIDTVTDEEETKDLELETMLRLVEEATKFRTEVAELGEAASKGKSNFTVMSGLQNEVSAVKEAIAVLWPAAEKSRNLCVNAKKKHRSAVMELLLVKNREKCFKETMKAEN